MSGRERDSKAAVSPKFLPSSAPSPHLVPWSRGALVAMAAGPVLLSHRRSPAPFPARAPIISTCRQISKAGLKGEEVGTPAFVGVEVLGEGGARGLARSSSLVACPHEAFDRDLNPPPWRPHTPTRESGSCEVLALTRRWRFSPVHKSLAFFLSSCEKHSLATIHCVSVPTRNMTVENLVLVQSRAALLCTTSPNCTHRIVPWKKKHE